MVFVTMARIHSDIKHFVPLARLRNIRIPNSTGEWVPEEARISKTGQGSFASGTWETT